ncbi:MAG: hypothetical protein HC910_21875 [Spirulinaceae cyanobacterium SM2_1_0]|nr:hypothetical protein [Spirulinaceae cyanobacterium SM2_1_0]
MNNGLLGFPGPQTWIDPRGRSFSMDSPPIWTNVSVWLAPAQECYSALGGGGERVVADGGQFGSILNLKDKSQLFNANNSATRPLTLQTFQTSKALYNNYSYVSNTGGMTSNVSTLAGSEYFAAIAFPATTYADYGAVLSTIHGSYVLLFQPGTAGVYHTSPLLSERNGVTASVLAPLNEWFLLRYRLPPATSSMRLWSDGRSDRGLERRCT